MAGKFTANSLGKRSEDELVEIASEKFSIDFDEGTTTDEMVDQILIAQDGNGGTVDDTDVDTDVEHVSEIDKGYRSDKKIKILIHNQEGAGGRDVVTASVNGVAWAIKRNSEVTVPERVVNVLRSAVETLYEEDPNDKDQMIEVDVPRFAMDVRGEA